MRRRHVVQRLFQFSLRSPLLAVNLGQRIVLKNPFGCMSIANAAPTRFNNLLWHLTATPVKPVNVGTKKSTMEFLVTSYKQKSLPSP